MPQPVTDGKNGAGGARRIEALRGQIGHFQYLALAFGTIIGSGWVILLGDWLTRSGPGGALVGFLCGGVVMMMIGACYAELTAQIPEAGSEFIYAYHVYGRPLAFLVGWFLVLYLISVTVFEGLALAWIAEIVFPNWKSATLYRAIGASISWETILIGLGAALIIFMLNFRGTRLAVISHSALTYGFLVVVLVVVAALVLNGRLSNALPLFSTVNGFPWWLGSGAIFAFCAYGLNGFQAIPQAVEERAEHISLRSIAMLIVTSIAAAALFYCIIIVAASMAAPWRTLASAALPIATAASALPHGQAFATALLLATAASLFKAWNGMVMMAARLLVALGRAGFLPHRFTELHSRYRSPTAALILILVLNCAGIFLGKGAVAPIADMCAMMLTLTYVLCAVTVLRLRRRGASQSFRVVGGSTLVCAGGIGAAIMAAVAFISPFYAQPGTVPLEWRLLGVWSLAGLIVWLCWARRAQFR